MFRISRPAFIIILILLNAVPVYGIFRWNWQSFNLIFLYWLENVIIGVFMILRILVRRYSHPVELAMPLFFAPFFTFHFGMFCYVHGTFIIALFGKGLNKELAGMDIPEIVLPLIQSQHLFWPVLALFIFQLIDWLRDVSERGFGSDGIKDLTTAPYRRIVVLHITILASGFALGALNEPVLGMLILITFKTGMDIYHLDNDEKSQPDDASPVINEKIKNKLEKFMTKPTITVNGKKIHYKNFQELKAAKHYKFMLAIINMIGGGKHINKLESYIEKQTQRQNTD